MKQFEERLSRLEAISDRIRDPDIPLEEALSCFEEGISLAKKLERDIEKIEGKIKVLMNPPGEQSETCELGLFDDDAEA